MVGSSDTSGLEASVPQKTKVKFIRGILMFYAVNFFAMLVGLKATKSLGNLEGILLMILLMFSLQALLGYLVLKKGKSIIR
jgi:hypothetical protein